MKKIISLIGALSLGLCMAYNVHSAAYTDGAADDGFVTVPSAVPNSDPIVYQKSARVIISGNTSATNFAHAAHHEQVEGKKNGRQFGMTAEVSSIFWKDISDGGTAPVNVVVTDSSAFATNFNKM